MVHKPPSDNKRPHPDFSCYLIRREVWAKVGEFDEGFTRAFCEDGDYDMRMWKAGIRGECIDLPYYHYGSATVKLAGVKEQRAIQKAADVSRKHFESKWGFAMASPEYYHALGKGEPPQAQSLPSN